MIGIVFIGNIEYCPYLEKYIKVLAENEVQFKVLFWNREISGNEYPDNYISFNKKMNNRKKKFEKALDFLQFRTWLKKQVTRERFKKLIILDTLSGILLSKVLINEYKGKYVFDIRDYSYEKNKLFYSLEEKIINCSNFTCISSEGFKSFLPKLYNYTIAHNFNYKDLIEGRLNFLNKKQYGETLNFVWIGSVRYYEHQVAIIKKLGNDSRFNIVYHGSGPDLVRLKEYCLINMFRNVKFTGKYSNAEKSLLLSDADIINNSYDINIGNEVKYAIANKFYDGIVFKIPQLVEIGSFKQEKVEKLKIGIGLDVNNNDFADKLYDYYFNIQQDEFNRNCENELENILEEDSDYLERIKAFIKRV